MKTKEEINSEIDFAWEYMTSLSREHRIRNNMSYEQGVIAALGWAANLIPEKPMDVEYVDGLGNIIKRDRPPVAKTS